MEVSTEFRDRQCKVRADGARGRPAQDVRARALPADAAAGPRHARRPGGAWRSAGGRRKQRKKEEGHREEKKTERKGIEWKRKREKQEEG